MDIEEEALEKLKCNDCDCYLSFPPIMIKRTGQNMCGRCYIETIEEKLERNHAYETIAENMLFPCRYAQIGCKEKLPWNKAQYHEEGCEFQIYGCPIYPTGSCEWTGLRSKLLAHFQKEHPSFILENPCAMKPDIKKNSEQNYLVPAHGFLFILQTKCGVTTSQLRYCLHFLGYVNLASLFEFTIDMKTSSNELKKAHIAASQKDFIFEKDNFIEICINSLLGNLGPYHEISFYLAVDKIADKFKLMECFYCEKFINSYEIIENKNYCRNCTVSTDIVRVCKNKYLGCAYADTPIDVRKHEKWFCTHDKSVNLGSKCLLCRLENNEIAKSSHRYHTVVTLDSFNKIYENTGKKYSYNIVYNTTVFACRWQFENNSLTFKVVSDIPKTTSQLYILSLKLYNPSNKICVRKTLDFDIKSLEYDWIVKLKNDSYKPFVHKQFFVDKHVDNLIESYGFELQIKEKARYLNLLFQYVFPNLNQNHFKNTIVSWKNVFVMTSIICFLDYALSNNRRPCVLFMPNYSLRATAGC